MTAGRPRLVDPGWLYALAQEFYWDFRHLAAGSSRWGFDADKYQRLIKELENTPFAADKEDRTHYERSVDYEIDAGYLESTRRRERLQEMERVELSGRREMFRQLARGDARKELRIPGEPDVLKGLLSAKTPEQVCKICKDAFVVTEIEGQPEVIKKLSIRNWPIAFGSMLPSSLSQFADEFVAATHDPRYPRSTSRPTNQLKQFWFLSRALAGAVFGVKTRTAINLVGSMRPEQVFDESRAAKPKRRRRRERNKP